MFVCCCCCCWRASVRSIQDNVRVNVVCGGSRVVGTMAVCAWGSVGKRGETWGNVGKRGEAWGSVGSGEEGLRRGLRRVCGEREMREMGEHMVIYRVSGEGRRRE